MTNTTSQSILTEADHEIFDREINGFLPQKVFDAHCHFTHPKYMTAAMMTGVLGADGIPEIVGWDQFAEAIGAIYPGRRIGALFLAYSMPNTDVRFGNQYTSDEAAKAADARFFMFVEPGDNPQAVEQDAKRLGASGFKVYHNRAPIENTFDADIPLYFPEWLAELAHKLGMGVTLHMVKDRGVADENNIRWIRHYCKTYPDMKLILAHSARGFQPSHNLEGLPQLTDLDNVYFDCSANCEPMAHQAIIRIMGHKRLMWGADFPVSHMRGRSLAAADTFIWLYGDTPVWGQRIGKIEPTLIGIENLRSMKYACWSEKLTDSQVEDIFWNNAAALFKLDS